MLENLYNTLLTKVKEGNKCVMLTSLDLQGERKGFIDAKHVLTEDEVNNKSYAFNEDIYEAISISLDTGKLQQIQTSQDKAILIEPFMPKPRLIVFGGGHIAKPLSEFASKVGFSVTVVDDRPFFANKGRFSHASEVICESFEKCFKLLKLRKTDFVVIVTRGHRHDEVVLKNALKYDLSYIGMIGSKRRVKTMMDNLLQEGYEKKKLDTVNAPIGLDISAITPEEIAVSIVSQLICFKNKGIVDKLGKDFVYPELDMDVAKSAAVKTGTPRALITIVSSKGSTPRKAGAKMLAYYDGSAIGSIGGGCSEAAVLSKARNLMMDKGFYIEHVDMTGDAAEDEGMVCGGVMEVLVEAFW